MFRLSITKSVLRSIVVLLLVTNLFSCFNRSITNNTDNEVQSLELASENIQETITVSGLILDSDGPLPGVSIIIKGTTIGTETDFDGKFTITMSTESSLVLSYLGYSTVEVTPKGFKKLKIKLDGSSENLIEYCCINHAESDCTSSISEMQEYTKDKGCIFK